jgi:hypothetical protein
MRYGTHSTCAHNHPDKYIEPIIKFRRYKAFKHPAVRDFYSVLRVAMIGAKGVDLLCKLINE